MSDTDGEVADKELNVDLEAKILELKREKRARKTAITKTKHRLQRLCAEKSDIKTDQINLEISQLWDSLEECLLVMDDLTTVFMKIKEEHGKLVSIKEAEDFEKEVHNVIEAAESVIKVSLETTQPAFTGATALCESPITGSTSRSNEAEVTGEKINKSRNKQVVQRLKPLKVPEFEGDKAKFEDYWGLFTSLVDAGEEPVNVKMARLRQSLKGKALEAIRSLGVSEAEYIEAKEILQSKFGGRRRQLQSYLEQLENMNPLKNSDVQGFEKFSDLVRVAVMKLQAEGRDGELGESSLHSLLVKKLTEKQVES